MDANLFLGIGFHEGLRKYFTNRNLWRGPWMPGQGQGQGQGTGCRMLQAGTKPALEAEDEKRLELKKQHEYILYSIYILYICKNK